MLDSHVHFKNANISLNDNYYYFLNSTNENDWGHLLNIANDFKNVLPFFGVHPWYIDTIKDDCFLKLEEIIKENKKYQVGEIGLDVIKYKKNKQLFDIDKQIEVFKKQLKFAVKYDRIVSVHCVKAWEYLFEIIDELNIKNIRGILHFFSSSSQVMEKLISYGFYVSFYSNIYDERNSKVLDAFLSCPLNRLLLESDVNVEESEALLNRHYDKAAKLKKIDKEELIRIVSKNGQFLSNTNFAG
jgi:TatD DNase family protein